MCYQKQKQLNSYKIVKNKLQNYFYYNYILYFKLLKMYSSFNWFTGLKKTVNHVVKYCIANEMLLNVKCNINQVIF